MVGPILQMEANLIKRKRKKQFVLLVKEHQLEPELSFLIPYLSSQTLCNVTI